MSTSTVREKNRKVELYIMEHAPGSCIVPFSLPGEEPPDASIFSCSIIQQYYVSFLKLSRWQSTARMKHDVGSSPSNPSRVRLNRPARSPSASRVSSETSCDEEPYMVNLLIISVMVVNGFSH